MILQDVTNVIRAETPKISVDPHVTDLWCGSRRSSDASTHDTADYCEVSDCTVRAPRVLLLDELLPPSGTALPVVLWHIPFDLTFPSVVLMHPQPTVEEVCKELACWGFDELVLRLPQEARADFLTVSPDIYKNVSDSCFVYLDPTQPSFMAYQITSLELRDLHHMQFLETFELPRAVITATRWLSDNTCLVLFHPGGYGKLLDHTTKDSLPPFPDRLPARVAAALSEQLTWCSESPGFFAVRLPFDCRELGSIFGTGKDILMTHLEDLQISDDSKQYIGNVTNLFDIQQADRLLIYVDGSSDPKHRHHHPEFAEHFGHTDAWSFVVLGERYDTGQLSFFGWTSQKICYDQTAGFYSGVTRLGADIAEREALIWAALWRLQLDSSIPTTFCYDCVSAGRFASGQQGAHEVTAQHAILRGLHQALHSAVGDRFLSYHHVKGHSACVWNDLADAAAKLCLRQVRFHRRQEFDLRKWTPIVPHLWLLFGTGNGLSSLHPAGVAVPPPDLPSSRDPTLTPFPVTTKTQHWVYHVNLHLDWPVPMCSHLEVETQDLLARLTTCRINLPPMGLLW